MSSTLILILSLVLLQSLFISSSNHFHISNVMVKLPSSTVGTVTVPASNVTSTASLTLDLNDIANKLANLKKKALFFSKTAISNQPKSFSQMVSSTPSALKVSAKASLRRFFRNTKAIVPVSLIYHIRDIGSPHIWLSKGVRTGINWSKVSVMYEVSHLFILSSFV
jgi:hypothetical protein